MRTLILGCHGKETDQVQLCGTTSFELLGVDAIPPADIEFHNFIFKIMRLDKFPATEHNKVVSTIRFLSQTGYLGDRRAESLIEWLNLHKRCGIYLYMRNE